MIENITHTAKQAVNAMVFMARTDICCRLYEAIIRSLYLGRIRQILNEKCVIKTDLNQA